MTPTLTPDAALFLDVDGTLLPIAPTPDAVVVADGLPDLLARVATGVGGALALVSGRNIATLDRLFRRAVAAVAGVHGLERRTAAGAMVERELPVTALGEARLRLHRFVGAHPDVLLEDKGVALALHYRSAPDQEAACLSEAEAIVAGSGGSFVLQPGKMVCELRPRGATKADAVAAFLDEPPFRGRMPVYVGDDLTDEDAFRLVNERGGLSIRVGGVEGSAACHGVDDVAAVLRWLDAFADNRAG